MTIKNRSKVCLIVSCAIIVLALVLSLFGQGINLGIDFAGGMSMEYDMHADFKESDITAVLTELGLEGATVTKQGQGGTEAVVRIKSISEEGVQGVQAQFEEKVKELYPDMTQSGDVNYVGPVAGATLLKNAILSVVIAAALMLIYIAIRFDLNSGLAAVFGLVHDVLMMLSFMVLLRNVVQMNSSFIAAALTIVGYSINNTIIIFDRIRENANKLPSATPRDEVVNLSVKESLGRTICTTLTTLITICALYILGVDSIKEFALPIIIGILSGVYSSNMINGYIWAALEERKRSVKAKK